LSASDAATGGTYPSGNAGGGGAGGNCKRKYRDEIKKEKYITPPYMPLLFPPLFWDRVSIAAGEIEGQVRGHPLSEIYNDQTCIHPFSTVRVLINCPIKKLLPIIHKIASPIVACSNYVFHKLW
jgi:hypothetical protein